MASRRKDRVFQVTEQRLCDQARIIRMNEWLTELEMD